ncbi:MAG: alginate O-acetyltransferase [Planctomycetota bacterium]|nr:MAG: alginate O-acetyltransferase [Planctomycetota bacterium]
MVFSSLAFLFLFLPLVLLAHTALMARTGKAAPGRVSVSTANLLLLATSLLFYVWGEGWLVWILLASSAVDFAAGLGIERAGWRSEGERARAARRWLAVSIASNLAFLGYFKYLGFGLDALRDLSGNDALFANVADVALPLGISFYTFQSMSYTIDVYRGAVPATRRPLDFACYVAMFPQLVAGPIVRYVQVSQELLSRRLDLPRFAWGLRRFVLGLAKKVLVANTLSVIADAAFESAPAELSAPAAWLGLLAYTFQIYFDFSGYSDMAIGLGALFGFRFPENFAWPYAARSIQDFWRRWHISLSTWFRDYLYFSLGGSRRGTAITARNLLLVFLLCGLWHGASWNFVLWGLLHGGFLAMERVGFARVLTRAPSVLRHAYVLLVVMLAWVLFRADDLPAALDYFGALVAGGGTLGALRPLLTPSVIVAFAVGAVACTGWPTHALERLRARPALASTFARGLDSLLSLGVCVALALLSTALLFQGASNPFIYFRF